MWDKTNKFVGNILVVFGILVTLIYLQTTINKKESKLEVIFEENEMNEEYDGRCFSIISVNVKCSG